MITDQIDGLKLPRGAGALGGAFHVADDAGRGGGSRDGGSRGGGWRGGAIRGPVGDER